MVSCTINGVAVDIEINAVITTDGTEGFDGGNIVVKHITKSDKYTEFDLVKITIDSDITYYTVQGDVITQINTTKYNHELTLMEYTLDLTKYVGADRYFTVQDDGSAYTLGQHAQIFVDTVPFGKTQVLAITAPTLALLNVDAPEKKYENQTLYQSFREIFRGVKAVPRLVSTGGAGKVLSHTLYNQKLLQIDLDEYIGYMKDSDANNYATTIKSKLKNLTYDGDLITAGTYFPAKGYGITTRSSQGDYDDAQAEYQFEMPIRHILQARILNLDSQALGTVIAEIGKFIVSKEEYDGMILGSRNVNTLRTQVAKRNSWYFTRGDTKIVDMAGTFKDDTGISRDKWDETIKAWWVQDSGQGDATQFKSQKLNELEIEFYYLPYIEADVTIDRSDNAITKRSTILSNQKDRILDAGRQFGIMKDQVNRLSNGNFVIKRKSTWANRWQDYDYTSDRYTIIKSSYIIVSENNVVATHELQKNYVTIDGYSAINREFRPYTISRDSVKSNFTYTEYIELSTTQRTQTGNLTSRGYRAMFNAFNFSSTYDLPVYHIQYQSDNMGIGVDPIARGCIGIGEEGFRFTYNFQDEKLAGNQLDRSSNLSLFPDGIDTVRYTEASGYMERASIYLVNNVVVNADTYPRTTLSTTPLFVLENKYYAKDPNEILGGTIEMLPYSDPNDTFIIYNKFSRNSSIVKELGVAQNYVVKISLATTVYDIYDTVTKEVTASTTYICDTSQGRFDIDSAVIGKTWAIVDSSDNLIIACNYDGTDRLRFYSNNLIEKTFTEKI